MDETRDSAAIRSFWHPPCDCAASQTPVASIIVNKEREKASNPTELQVSCGECGKVLRPFHTVPGRNPRSGRMMLWTEFAFLDRKVWGGR